MMRSRLSLRNLARSGLNICVSLSLICGCTASTSPTYTKADIDKSVERILQNEYKLKAKARLVGQTFWLYLPLEDIFEQAKKPEKVVERFEIQENDNDFKNNRLRLNYLIKTVPEREKSQGVAFKKVALEKITNAVLAMRRVIFSLGPKDRNAVKFYCLIASDIKNGYVIKELFYYEDLKKVTYDFISVDEYRHRVIVDSGQSLRIIGDREGRNIAYSNITLKDFVAGQIIHRINLKFQKPEVKANADIDKEITKIVVETLNIYKVENVSAAELNNMVSKKKTVLSEQEIYPRTMK
jgi:hypothetical protein